MKATRLLLVFLLSASLIPLLGCKEPTGQKEAVNQALQDLIAADNRGDLKSVLAAYTQDVEFYSTKGFRLKGIKAVEAHYTTLFKEKEFELRTTIFETEVVGSHAIIKGRNRGTLKGKSGASTTEVNDRYIAILQRNTEGIWQIKTLIWGFNP